MAPKFKLAMTSFDPDNQGFKGQIKISKRMRKRASFGEPFSAKAFVALPLLSVLSLSYRNMI
jgi:hypothetical protein